MVVAPLAHLLLLAPSLLDLFCIVFSYFILSSSFSSRFRPLSFLPSLGTLSARHVGFHVSSPYSDVDLGLTF